MIIEPSKPICSACCKSVKRVVAFLAKSVRDGQVVSNRGSSRMVRLCVDCVDLLKREFKS